MRVLHVVPQIGSGGAERCATDLVRGLIRTGIDARICVLDGSRVVAERLEGIANPILMNFRGSHRDPADFIRFRREFLGVVDRGKPDIVHAHLWPACRWTGLVLTNTTTPLLWHIHDTRDWLQSSALTDRLLRIWTRLLIRRVRPTLLAVSKAAAEYTARSLRVRDLAIERVPNFVDPRIFGLRAPPKNSVPVVGMVAQFRPEKGHDILLRAIQRLEMTGVALRLRLAGSGETLERSRRLCHDLGLKCVEFFGHISNVPAFLGHLDFLVLPSTKFEGLPVSILEAMSVGVPVIATDVAGTGEIVIHRKTGLLVRPNDPKAIAEALSWAISNRESMNRMAATAKSIVLQHHSIDAALLQISRLYQARLSLT